MLQSWVVCYTVSLPVYNQSVENRLGFNECTPEVRENKVFEMRMHDMITVQHNAHETMHLYDQRTQTLHEMSTETEPTSACVTPFNTVIVPGSGSTKRA